LQIRDSNDNVAVEYYDANGQAVYLPLDAFLSKSNVRGNLLTLINKFL
jgi:hypothetical protein